MPELRALLKEITPRRADSLALLLEPPADGAHGADGAELALPARLDRLVALAHWVTSEGRAGLEAMAQATTLGRLGSEEDMAAAAVYLASRASDFVTGVAVPVDGGYAVSERLLHD